MRGEQMEGGERGTYGGREKVMKMEEGTEEEGRGNNSYVHLCDILASQPTFAVGMRVGSGNCDEFLPIIF